MDSLRAEFTCAGGIVLAPHAAGSGRRPGAPIARPTDLDTCGRRPEAPDRDAEPRPRELAGLLALRRQARSAVAAPAYKRPSVARCSTPAPTTSASEWAVGPGRARINGSPVRGGLWTGKPGA